MNIVPLLLFCSLALVVGSIVLFVFSAKQGDCDESDRLCLLPLEDDAEVRPVAPAPTAGDVPGAANSRSTTHSSPESES